MIRKEILNKKWKEQICLFNLQELNFIKRARILIITSKIIIKQVKGIKEINSFIPVYYYNNQGEIFQIIINILVIQTQKLDCLTEINKELKKKYLIIPIMYNYSFFAYLFIFIYIYYFSFIIRIYY